MRTISVSRDIPASRAAVWGVLADFPNIADWNSGVKKSFSTSESVEGVGAQRHCDLAPAGKLEETVVGWQPEEQLVIRIDSAATLPIKTGEVTFSLVEDGDFTATSVDYDFETKFGPIGSLMGPMIEKQLTKGFTGFLDDLEAAAKNHSASAD